MRDLDWAIGLSLEKGYVRCSGENIKGMLLIVTTVGLSESKLFGALEWSKIEDLTTQQSR